MTLLTRPRKAVTAALALAAASFTPAMPSGLVDTASAQATAAEVRPGVELLPPGVLVHTAVPDMNTYRQRASESPSYGLFTDESLAGLREKIGEYVGMADQQLQAVADITIQDILDLPQGELSFTIMSPPGEMISGVLILDYGENGETVDKILDVLEDQAIKSGGEILSEEVGDQELVTVIIGDNSPVPPSVFSYNYMLRDNVWVMATNLDALMAVNDRWDSNSELTFAEDEVFNEVMDEVDLGFDREPIMMAYFDPIGLIKAGINTAADLSPEAAQAQIALPFFPILGLDNLKAMGTVADIDPANAGAAYSNTFIRLDRTGNPSFYDIFALAAADNTPPAFVGADVDAYASTTWQVDKAFGTIETFIDQYSGMGQNATRNFLDQIKNMPDGPGVHIKDDVLDQITGRLVTATDTTGRGDQISQRQLISIELTKSSTLPDTIERLIADAGAEVDRRDFRGTTIYQMEIPSQSPAGAMRGETQIAALAVAGGYIHFATEVSILEQALRGVEDTLAESDRYAELTEEIPRATLGITVQKSNGQMEQMWELARSGTFDQFTDQIGYDLKELPPFAEIKKYFGSAVSYSVRKDNGVLLRSFGVIED